ncbi:MAG: response regulator [Lachnospiraceae bacterium]|nr:response regulator [Lachnospiraceae bacterium]
MKSRKTENFIVSLLSLACIGLTLGNYTMKWEFWVPPLIIIGMIFLWVVNVKENLPFEIRKAIYLTAGMLAAFYQGIHDTSFFDVAVVMLLFMVTYSLFDRVYMMNIILVEYIFIMSIQILLNSYKHYVEYDAVNIARLLTQLVSVGFVYGVCVKAINDRVEMRDSESEKERVIEENEKDTEDFLSNISHELRTPVNVVKGMSDLVIGKNGGKEAESIKKAGIRLSYQIDDILDYTECKREKLLLEEEEYQSIDLISYIIKGFKQTDNRNRLELVVDQDPALPNKMWGDLKKLLKILRHLMENAVKFTRQGGIYVKMYSENTDYGVNLCIEISDTGIGMSRKAMESLAKGMYQVNKKRDRSSGGIGLGLFIVYGFTHSMGGFVKIESEEGMGSTVRVTIPQKIADSSPCYSISESFNGNVLFHVRSDKYKNPKVREFYRAMASNLATGLRTSLYSAETVDDIERLMGRMRVSHIFMGEEEYLSNSEYFDKLSREDVAVVISANKDFKPARDSQVIVMPKPLYADPVIRIINEGKKAELSDISNKDIKPAFPGVKALIVDDEPMNLIVASSLFSSYKMDIETAGSGMEAIQKYGKNDYDIVFMDHMMPGMDGVEAMKRIRDISEEENRYVNIVALTANVVSGAKEMFIREGFDGFIAKPINIPDFERVMLQLLPGKKVKKGGKRA